MTHKDPCPICGNAPGETPFVGRVSLDGKTYVEAAVSVCTNCTPHLTLSPHKDMSMSALDELRREVLSDLQNANARKQLQINFLLAAIEEHRVAWLEANGNQPADPVDALLWDAANRVREEEV
jgi:hypothetical protein